MQPKKIIKDSHAEDLFRSRLTQILNPRHPLFLLADRLDWSVFEEVFGSLYVDGVGRPGLPIRLLVGLHYLKHAYGESDESVVEKFLENPYWQYFCGYEYFQHEFPLDATSLVKWRHRVGDGGMERLLEETIATAQRQQLLKRRDIAKVNVDTTVQEKAISFPTDAKLYHTMRVTLVKAARERGFELRQSYQRLSKASLRKQGQYRHARQLKRANKETKKLRNYLGRVLRNIHRVAPHPDEELLELLVLADRIYRQKRHDSPKVYSVHAPEVECICKGKAHKRYEFGCKVSLVSTSRSNWVIGAQAHHGSPYDGHTLRASLDQATQLTGGTIRDAYCDRGYRGATKTAPEGVTVRLAGRKRTGMTRSQKKWLKRRSAIEPIIGHLKAEHGMGRNHLLGREGDRINVLLCGCGFNVRKLLRAFLWLLFRWFIFGQKHDQNNHNLLPVATTCA